MKKFVVLFFLTAAVGAYAQQNSIDMVLIKGGTFTMGIPASGRRTFIGEGTVWPAHQVTVSDFYMGKYEVTYEMGSWRLGSRGNGRRDDIAKNPDNPTRNGWKTLPVHNVTWYDAIEFCNELSVLEGLSPYYTIDKSQQDPNNTDTDDTLKWTVTLNTGANGYRLPSEAQWEYAAKGGNPDAAGWVGYTYSGSDTVGDVAWYSQNSDDKTHEVGKKAPNRLGLYDMSGNVYEWCWDWMGAYKNEAQTDPLGAVSGTYRVIRGGSWRASAGYVRSAAKSNINPLYWGSTIGFRLVRP